MTRSQIEYILALDKWRNFSKAAEACYVTQSTLSALVAKFEQQHKITIFDRKTRPISITPQGEEILVSLRSIHREYQLLDDRISKLNGQEIGKISISCIPTVAHYLYPMVLNHITTEYKKVKFTINEMTTENTINEIIGGNVDIGIVSIPLENKNLVEYKLYDEDFLVYDCGNKVKNKKYTVSNIEMERLWLMEEGHCMRNQVGKICELRQIKKMKSNLTYSCGTIYTLIEMVKINRGITLLPRLATINNVQIDPTDIYKISGPMPVRRIGIVTHKNFLKKRILKGIQSIITEVMQPHLIYKKNKSNIIDPY